MKAEKEVIGLVEELKKHNLESAKVERLKEMICSKIPDDFFGGNIGDISIVDEPKGKQVGNGVWESASDAQKNATAVYNAMVEYVRNALTESRESQKKLADRAGVSQGTVTSFLSGGRSVGTNLTLALLEASGIDTFDMFYTYIDKKEEETA